MNGLERLRAVIRAQPTDRSPVIAQLFGVTAVLAGESVRSYVTQGETLARCQLDAWRRFGHDAVFAIADLCVEAEALGSTIVFPEDNYPYVTSPAVHSIEAVDRLALPDPHVDGRIPQLLNATRLLVEGVADQAAVIACVTGPMTILARVMDIEKMLYAIVDTPDQFQKALHFCRDVSRRLMRSLLEEGAHGILVFDPAASPSVLPEKIFAAFESEVVRSLFDEAKRIDPETITWYSVAGPIHTNRSLLTELGPDIMTVDYVVPVEQALQQAYPVVINGNIMPQMFVEGSAEEIRAEASRLLGLGRTAERFVLGSGCEIPLDASAENIQALMDAVGDEENAYTYIPGEPGVEVTILPHRIRTSIPFGESLLTAIRQSHISITSYCNRSGSCGRCVVQVRSGPVSPPDDVERHHATEEAAGERLSCLARAEGDVTLYIPQEYRVRPNLLVLDRSFFETSLEAVTSVYGFDPLVKAVPIDSVDELPGPSLSSIKKRIKRFAETGERPLYKIVNTLDDVILDVTHDPHILGLAVDIGTTSLTGYVVDLTSGQIVCVAIQGNLQMEWGADIISRADAARDPQVLKRLQECLVEGINRLIKQYQRDYGVNAQQIYAISVVGNPVITHLLFGLNPERLARAPFTSSISGRLSFVAEALECSIRLATNRRCLVVSMTSVKGFVGSDTVAGLLATGVAEREEPSLFIDIGTNGEVAIGGSGGLYCSSVAAGPVFENMHMSCAVGFQRGVIDSLAIDDQGEITYTTVGSVAPIGLCGPSIIDTLAEFIRHGIVNERGKFVPRADWPHVTNEYCVLVPRERTAYYKAIVFTAKDMEEAQKALSAIRTGLAILLEESGIDAKEIRDIYVSGSFGFSLNVDNAIYVGMLPDWPWARYHIVRNTAGLGALGALTAGAALKRSEELAHCMRHVNLADHPSFFNRFIDNMFLPVPR